MIITRAPLRITLGGGGTDVPAYYERHGGLCIAAAIDKYVYIAVHRRPDSRLVCKYVKMEDVAHRDELQHPIIREALKLHGLDGCGMEIVSFADIPAGTGLGSSGAFTVALLKALHAFTNTNAAYKSIAEDAAHIEIDLLREPIGKQDQFIAAYGGVQEMHFNPPGQGHFDVAVNPTTIGPAIEDSLLLFFTGYSRSASEVLASGNAALKAENADVINSLHLAKHGAAIALTAIANDAPASLGLIFHEHWEAKRLRLGMSNHAIDKIYATAIAHGAYGGKLVGAGGGGYLLFVAHDKAGLRKVMQTLSCQEARFRIDHEGVKLLSI